MATNSSTDQIVDSAERLVASQLSDLRAYVRDLGGGEAIANGASVTDDAGVPSPV